MPRTLWTFSLLATILLPILRTQAAVIVEDGRSLSPVIIAADAPLATREAAQELVDYLHKISGASAKLIAGMPDPVPARAIWVGVQPGVEKVFKGLPLSFEQPEEILIAINESHVLIAGRDQSRQESQSEFGTANAVYTFLQKYLHVRWLWPGELGEDLILQKTITLEPTVYRFAPQLRERKVHYPPSVTAPEETNQWWKVRMRGRGSLPTPESHSFNDWWERYHQSHPEYFAMQPNGQRTPPQMPQLVKLCVSNPAVAEQWLDNAEEILRNDPTMTLIGAKPNDGGGWCVCENCKAWDHPDAPEGILTDRYVRFWNILARGIKERFPDRKIMISVLAYSRNRTPPIGLKLEDNICVGYVGSYPMTNEAERQQQKKGWLQWSSQAMMMRYRPNLFWYSGGVWGFPSYEPHKTIEDFRFIADNACIGIEIDSGFMNWSTLGPQLYLIAQLAYDPRQDGEALLADYYERGFGPAAEDIRRYFDLMEQAHQKIVETPGHLSSGGYRSKVLEVMAGVYDDAFLSQARAVLDDAASAVSSGPELYHQRVAFIRSGLDFVKLQCQVIAAMKKVRDTGARRDAIDAAIQACEARDALAAAAPPFAIDYKRILSQIRLRKMQEYLGPLSAELQQMAQSGQAVQYAPPKWTLAFEDTFDRDSLGENWTLTNPDAAKIENGDLVIHSATLLTTQAYPGLHRLELEVTGLPDSQGRYGDLSPFIHASSADINTGYLMQFGGMFNTINSIRKLGRPVADNRTHAIKPDTPHRIIAEFNGSYVRLSIDNRTIMRQLDPTPLVGPEHERMGFYVWSGARIHRIRILTAPAVPLQQLPLNDPDLE